MKSLARIARLSVGVALTLSVAACVDGTFRYAGELPTEDAGGDTNGTPPTDANVGSDAHSSVADSGAQEDATTSSDGGGLHDATVSDAEGATDGTIVDAATEQDADSGPHGCDAGTIACGTPAVCEELGPTYCGSCTNNCTTLANVDAAAVGCEIDAGTCILACLPGFAHCSSSIGTGCETQISDDPKNCGACGYDCTALPNIGNVGDVTCSAGQCVIPPSACATGYAHCTSNVDAGCETSLAANGNCGACAVTCSGVDVCGPVDAGVYGCVSSCPVSDPEVCSNSCVNTSNNPSYCGSCSYACPAAPSYATETCAIATDGGALCDFNCTTAPYTTKCDGTKCVNTAGDLNNCGGCDVQCHPPTNGDGIASCVSNGSGGYACAFACNSSFPTTCGTNCVNTTNDALNCGSCGHSCAAPSDGEGAAKCVASVSGRPPGSAGEALVV